MAAFASLVASLSKASIHIYHEEIHRLAGGDDGVAFPETMEHESGEAADAGTSVVEAAPPVAKVVPTSSPCYRLRHRYGSGQP